jgi:hypothetical protein
MSREDGWGTKHAPCGSVYVAICTLGQRRALASRWGQAWGFAAGESGRSYATANPFWKHLAASRQ